jgi:hypothetical protein
VAVTARDKKIGWTPEAVIEELTDRPTARLAAWLNRIVDDAINEIYKVDLLEDEILSTRDLSRPSGDMVARLEQGTLDRVAAHNFVHPIRHGARVRAPREDQE